MYRLCNLEQEEGKVQKDVRGPYMNKCRNRTKISENNVATNTWCLNAMWSWETKCQPPSKRRTDGRRNASRLFVRPSLWSLTLGLRHFRSTNLEWVRVRTGLGLYRYLGPARLIVLLCAWPYWIALRPPLFSAVLLLSLMVVLHLWMCQLRPHLLSLWNIAMQRMPPTFIMHVEATPFCIQHYATLRSYKFHSRRLLASLHGYTADNSCWQSICNFASAHGKRLLR